jgi:DNA-binding transcriptional MerR regulator
MTTMRIAQVAALTGVPATTLRYYEDIGLLAPAGRSGNGYREYADRDLERLAFISRAKQLDISLDELKELVEVWDTDDCSQVHDRMRTVVASRVVETQSRMAELVELARQLQAAAVRLAAAPVSAGACGDDCACMAAPDESIQLLPIPLVRPPSDSKEAIACSLDSGTIASRVAEWRAVAARATSRYEIDGGVGLAFEHDALLTVEIARLAAAEYTCCSFLRFAFAIDDAGMRVEISTPPHAQALVTDLFGQAT